MRALAILIISFFCLGSINGQGACGTTSCGAIPTDGVPDASWFSSGSPAQVGQSFTLCSNLTITELNVHVGSGPSSSLAGTLIIRDVASCGAVGTVGAIVEYSQPITIDTASGNQVFTLTTPFNAMANTTYAWIIEAGTGFDWSISRSSVDYQGHSLLTGPSGGGCNPGDGTCQDALFAFNAPAFIDPPTETIPTMGQWAIICLLLIMVIMGIVSIKELNLAPGKANR